MYWFDGDHSTERSRECQRRTLYERAELLSVPSAGSWWLHGVDVPGRCVLEMAARHLSWYVVVVHSGVG